MTESLDEAKYDEPLSVPIAQSVVQQKDIDALLLHYGGNYRWNNAQFRSDFRHMVRAWNLTVAEDEQTQDDA